MSGKRKKKPPELFGEPIDGVFGRFKTKDSYPVDYILSSVPIARMERLLSTASDAFHFGSIDFEQLMQRDVDLERVDDKIVKEYLEIGKGRVLFFPPLIVSVVATKDDRPLERYESIDTKVLPVEADDPEDQEIVTVFDKDKYQVSLSRASVDTGHKMSIDGDEAYFYHYLATLRISTNPSKVKLVVIDGQHRFEALRRLYAKTPDLLEGMEVPLCIVYTPAATEDRAPNETITRDLREMFVRVNKTPKVVSGHFIELLNDNSLASMSVRELANKWKNSDENPSRSHLQLLEWNERQDSRSSTRQRDYTVTTVSILCDALRKAFADKNLGITSTILNLQEREADLEFDDAPTYDDIQDDNFTVEQAPVIQEQVNKYLVPGLDHLLRCAPPYETQWKQLCASVDELEAKAAESLEYKVFLEKVLGQFRRCSKKDQDEVKLVQNTFDTFFDLHEDEKVYFLNVFQQGVIRGWLEVCQIIVESIGVSPKECAQAIIDGLAVTAFDARKQIFSRERPYATLLLYQNTKPRSAAYGKEAWKCLVLACLLDPDAWERFSRSISDAAKELPLEDVEQCLEDVRTMLEESLESYRESMNSMIQSNIRKEWRVRPYPKALKDKLTRLFESKKPEDKDRFEEELQKLVTAETNEAGSKLTAKLSVAMP